MILQSLWYTSSECWVGFSYGGNDPNLYRLAPQTYIEFLDVEKENDPANLVQSVCDLLHIFTCRLLTLALLKWQVEVGKKYEIIVTSNDGLWRYQLNDIVEVAGFAPGEGTPLIRHVQRKGYVHGTVST